MGSARPLIISLLTALQLPASAQSEQITSSQSDLTVITYPAQKPKSPISQPDYPASSVFNNEEGAVILKFNVRVDGSVDPSTIVVGESSGFRSLDMAAIAEAEKWTFEPGTKNGKPVESPHHFRVVFELRGQGGPVMEMRAEDFPGTLNGDPGLPFVPMNIEGGDGYAP
ncbi:energy transducer TonB [Iodidimonas sp. SYSU 1G8]|uniref:energy transducer TonB n=1 Tax=Iodidimonas sp. SYSU 1G8 TaxID=3133967 RepID=UPI0031FE4DC7